MSLDSAASMSDNSSLWVPVGSRSPQSMANMRIVAHRGFWQTQDEKNTRAAFERALEGGFGIETDVRDALGKLVISHDMPRGAELEFGAVLDLCSKFPDSRPLALNVKSDGMQKAMRDELARCATTGHYVFDMSVPDTLGYLREGIPVFTRLSEFEPVPAFAAKAVGVWLDAFESDWFDIDSVRDLVERGKHVCVVSPELHGRDHAGVWKRLLDSPSCGSPLLSICTDFPDRAAEYFRG
jgi:glycerophosphoryl diester phosphodiesterase